jgi:hypothetical protein
VRTQPCNAEILQGRLHKAGSFMDAANVIHEFADQDEEVADAYATLCVHAGIAASDVICCINLGEHAKGESHSDAVELLKRVDKDAAKQLNILLNLKTKSGYSHTPVTAAEFKRVGRAATALVEKARRAHASAGR